MKPRILVVDDEPSVQESLIVTLEDDYDITAVSSGEEALNLIPRSKYDLVLLDILMPGMNGIRTLEAIRETDDDLQVIMLTAVKDIQKADESMKLGAFDYIPKPYKLDELRSSIAQALKVNALQKENIYLRSELEYRVPPPVIIGSSGGLRETINMARQASSTDSTVLIAGETGTGKELMARFLYQKSDRAGCPFVVVNCSTIAETIMESELFGHEKGAFTSAHTRKIGKLEMAHTGTAFLDEVSSLSLEMQMKFLRVLQEKTIERVGGHKVIPIDVRFIAATNMDLKQAVEEKTFREDLYYRLNVIPITIPPLRQRRDDIPLLVDHFIQHFNLTFHKDVNGVSDEVMDIFLRYHWPGNVRELENLIERMTVLSPDQIVPLSMVPQDMFLDVMEYDTGLDAGDFDLKKAMDRFEKRFLTDVLRFSGWNEQRAADLMGIHRSTVMNKKREHGISKPHATVENH